MRAPPPSELVRNERKKMKKLSHLSKSNHKLFTMLFSRASLQRGLRIRPSTSAPLLISRSFRRHHRTAVAMASASSSGQGQEEKKTKPEPVDPATLFDGGAGAADLRALCVGACSR